MEDDLKNFGFNVGAGTLEALALQVEGSANIVDETVNRFRELIDKEPTRFLRDATGQIVADLDAGSESLRNKITSDMKIRQLEALPAVGMPFGTALPGGEQALDRAGNPYGTDKWATFLNASEEFGDVFIDMAITAIPYVGPALTLALGTAEGQADAQRRIEDEVKKGMMALKR